MIFSNTKTAFAYKSDAELKRARLLFWLMGNTFFLNLGLILLPFLVKIRFPFIQSIIRHTLFKQFVGGETLQQTTAISDLLLRYNVQTILDYGAEAGESESSFDIAAEKFVEVIKYAATQKSIPYMSIKVTAIARFALLEKIDVAMHASGAADLQKRYLLAIGQLTKEEREEWNTSVLRLVAICEAGNENKIGVLIDAEESWVQDPVDALAMQMIEKYNREKCIVFNTFQMYRQDRLEFLKQSHIECERKKVCLGVKLVRGAYMEKERERAMQYNYQSPIHENKEMVDADYNLALEYCLSKIERISLIVATHNEYSNVHCTWLMSQYGLPSNHSHIHFSQLYGMSDHITFNLAKYGFNASKYIPFGPIKEVIPYLMRRAKENSSVAGQTGRELGLIKKELTIRRCVDVEI